MAAAGALGTSGAGNEGGAVSRCTDSEGAQRRHQLIGVVEPAFGATPVARLEDEPRPFAARLDGDHGAVRGHRTRALQLSHGERPALDGSSAERDAALRRGGRPRS